LYRYGAIRFPKRMMLVHNALTLFLSFALIADSRFAFWNQSFGSSFVAFTAFCVCAYATRRFGLTNPCGFRITRGSFAFHWAAPPCAAPTARPPTEARRSFSSGLVSTETWPPLASVICTPSNADKPDASPVSLYFWTALQ